MRDDALDRPLGVAPEGGTSTKRLALRFPPIGELNAACNAMLNANGGRGPGLDGCMSRKI